MYIEEMTSRASQPTGDRGMLFMKFQFQSLYYGLGSLKIPVTSS